MSFCSDFLNKQLLRHVVVVIVYLLSYNKCSDKRRRQKKTIISSQMWILDNIKFEQNNKTSSDPFLTSILLVFDELRERERELENKKAGFGSCEMVSRFRQEDDGGGEFIGRADSRKIHSHKKLLFRYFDARDWSGVNFSCQIEIAFLRSKFKHIFTDLHFVTTSKELTEDDKDILFDRQEWCL